ncbi:MAG TPA: AsmA family protein [Bacteroidales bacterium]
MKILKKILKWFGIVLFVLVAALFIFTSFLINHFKPDVEQAFKSRTGMEAQIEGNLQLKILPGISLVINKLNLINNETYFLRTENAEFELDLQSWLVGPHTIIKAISFKNPQIFIFKNENGKYNFDTGIETPVKTSSSLNFNLTDLKVEGGKLLYFDTNQSDTLTISGVSLSTVRVKADGNFENFSLKNSYFEGNLSIKNLKLNALQLNNVLLKVVENNELFLLTPGSPAFYGGSLSGKATIDVSQNPVKSNFTFTASDLKIDSLLMDFETALYLKGNVNIEADIQFESYDWELFQQNMQGNINLSGENVLIYGFNTEVVLDNFAKTGKFNAINAGAALMAGPVGAVLINNKGLASLLTYDSGDSLLAKKFISKWKFNNGKAIAEDVAFSDGKYRIAVSGALDFLNSDYENLAISLLNVSGCPVLSQQINNSFDDATLQMVSFYETKNGNNKTLKEAVLSRSSCDFPYHGIIF